MIGNAAKTVATNLANKLRRTGLTRLKHPKADVKAVNRKLMKKEWLERI